MHSGINPSEKTMSLACLGSHPLDLPLIITRVQKSPQIIPRERPAAPTGSGGAAKSTARTAAAECAP